jgi:hypothetical protein
MVAHMNYNVMIVVVLLTEHVQYIPDNPCPNFLACSQPECPLSSPSLSIRLYE